MFLLYLTMFFTALSTVTVILGNGKSIAKGPSGVDCLLFFDCFSAEESPDYTHTIQLNQKYTLSWLTTDNSTEIIFRGILEESSGFWMGLGFSPEGKMKDSDIFMFYIFNDKPEFIDGHANKGSSKGYGMPNTDKISNWKLLEGSSNNTHTWFVAKRKLDTCDREEDRVITADQTNIIWGYGKVVTKDSKPVPEKHVARGMKTLYLMNERPLKALLDQPGSFKIDLKLSKKVPIPTTTEPFYWCEIFEIGKRPKGHLIGYEVVTTPATKPYLHQVLIYRCRKDMADFVGKPGRCFTGNSWNKTKNPISNCGQEYIGSWSFGGDPYIYPENLGQPMFVNDGPVYFMLEIHYDNSIQMSGIKDQSTVSLHLTENQRSFESGSLVLGTLFGNGQLIPPGQNEFTSYSYCPNDCTKELDEQIHVFGAYFHTHILGRAVRLRHKRNGVELPVIFEDNAYTFKYQSMMLRKHPVTVEKGDELIVECVYSSIDKDKATTGGYNMGDESCFVYLDYYPRRQNGVEYCSSGPDTTQVYRTLGATHYSSITPDTPITGKNGTLMSVATFIDQDVDWNPEMVDKLQKMVKTGPHIVFCTIGVQPRDDGEFQPRIIPLAKPPELVHRPLNDNKDSCQSDSGSTKCETCGLDGCPKCEETTEHPNTTKKPKTTKQTNAENGTTKKPTTKKPDTTTKKIASRNFQSVSVISSLLILASYMSV